MPNLNLNSPGDFAKLTMSTAGAALFQLTGLQSNLWDIQEGSYGHPPAQPVLFHVFKSSVDFSAEVESVKDTAGRRKVPYKYPYVDGQTTDDLGREGESWDVNILIHGPNYKAQYNKLIAEFNNPAPGTFNHPVRGGLKVAVSHWEVTHSSQSRQAVALVVHFIEHNFDVSFTRDSLVNKSVKSKISAALAFMNKIATVINTIQSTLLVAQSFKTLISQSLAAYQNAFGSNLVQINATFNNGSSSDLPGLLPTNQGPTGSQSFTVAVSPTDPLSALPPSIVNPQTTAALQSQQAVNQVIALRNQLNATIALYEEIPDGSLIFYDDILTLKQSAIAMQDALETGLQSSNAQLINYITPRLMTLREVAYANGLTPESALELEVLNPNLLSTNFIPKGTSVQVALG